VACVHTCAADAIEDSLASLVGPAQKGGGGEGEEEVEKEGGGGGSTGAGLGLADRVLIDAPCSNTGVMRRCALMLMCVCVRVCVRACLRACVRAVRRRQYRQEERENAFRCSYHHSLSLAGTGAAQALSSYSLHP
jgi:hypothetical protein